jgi:hypothetical protein
VTHGYEHRDHSYETRGFPKKDAPQAFREMAEKGTTQAKESYEKMNAATTEAADLIKIDGG